MRLRVFFFTLCLLFTQHLFAAEPLIEPHEAVALLQQYNVQAIDIRSGEDYSAGHIPGAISAPYALWRGPAHNPGALANTEELQTLVRKLGLTNKQHLVVYSSGADDTDFGAAARVYWTLKYLGFSHLSVLNGGYKYWQKQASHSVENTTNQLANSTVQVNVQPQLVVFKDELVEKINSPEAAYQLLDARPIMFYQGQMKAPTASTAGTIASAQNVTFQQWFVDGETLVRPASEIKTLVAEQGLNQAPETLSFCNTGHWAATNWFVLSEIAELENVRLYPASLAEWTQHPEALPMENTPTRSEQIKAKFQQLFKK